MSDPERTAALRRWLELSALAMGLGVTFLALNVIHFRFFPVYVILYACVLDATIAAAIFLPVFWRLRRRRTHLSPTEFMLGAVVGCLVIILYAVMGPTVADRSLSLYLVQKVELRGGEVAQAKMKEIFIDEYIPEYRLVDVRLTEQVRSGTMIIENGCVKITPRGRFIAHTALIYRKLFLPHKRVLLGQVTDELSDPFRKSKPVVDTTCRK